MPHGTVNQSQVAPSTIFVGLDVHKESVTLAVLPADAPAPVRVDKLPYDLKKLRRYLEKLGPAATLRTCYEASGAGYVLQRELATWGIACTVIAPSLIPTKPGVQRKHDKYDASQLARLFRAGGTHRRPHPDGGRGARARSGALSLDVPARDPEVAALRAQVPRAPWARVSRGHAVAAAALRVAAAPGARRFRTRRRGSHRVRGIPRAARVQTQSA
ncbi:MAG: hypothetical protein U5K74_12260 [Gemmatimonadaceae bacterium]|nr:hypothetical protein [Gemmatimonadaceae bacterium]